MNLPSGSAIPVSTHSRLTCLHILQVTVTGGTGYIASVLIQQLLEKGYTVNATVRSAALTNPKVLALVRLAEAFPGELRLFEADLLVPGTFDAAVCGSSYVFHVASVVAFVVSLPKLCLVYHAQCILSSGFHRHTSGDCSPIMPMGLPSIYSVHHFA